MGFKSTYHACVRLRRCRDAKGCGCVRAAGPRCGCPMAERWAVAVADAERDDGRPSFRSACAVDAEGCAIH